jgi:hypothetical protein
MARRKASKIIFSGLEGSGKSLRLAYLARAVLKSNAYFLTKTNIARPIYTNIKFSDVFKELAKSKGIPIIEWSNLDELVGVSGCDIFIDEIGTYFDSRLWTELPLTVRRWIAQCDKNGVNIYGTAQDFAQVDKSFRRLVSKLYHIKKVMGSARPHVTYPTIRFPWGLFMTRELDPRGYKEDDPKLDKAGFPSFFLLDKADYSIYSTSQSIEMSKALPLRHLVRACLVCGLEKVTHS